MGFLQAPDKFVVDSGLAQYFFHVHGEFGGDQPIGFQQIVKTSHLHGSGAMGYTVQRIALPCGRYAILLAYPQTTMLRKVGKEHLAELLQTPRYKLYDRDRNGGLWVGKEYGISPAWQRDPLHSISHGATAMQVARFYYLLETNRLVSAELTVDMKEILSKPAINHKFVRGLQKAHPDSNIYRKSGSWRQFHADSAMVERDGRRYIAVGLVENQAGGQWLAQLIVEMDKLIFSGQEQLADGDAESIDAGV